MARAKSSSKAVSEMVSRQMRSDQPVYNPTDDLVERDIQIGHAINWYNALSSDKKERKWYWEYAKENKLFKGDELSRIKVADSKMFYRVGRFARMTLDGFPLEHDAFIQKTLADAKDTITEYLKPKKKTVAVAKVQKPSVQDRMDEKSEELTGKILCMVDAYVGDIKKIKKGDDNNHINIESFLNVEEVKPLIAKRIIPHLEYAASEWDVLLSTKDAEIKEAYNYLTLSEQKRIQRAYKKVLDELALRASQKRKRKARAKKTKTPQEITSKVKYQKDTKDYGGHTSVDPSKIIGKSRVILFNTKYREFQIVDAENEKIGLTIEGTTIKGIDSKTSTSKRVREQYVENLLNTSTVKGIRAIRAEYKKIKAAEKTPTGRLNDHTLIIRAM